MYKIIETKIEEGIRLIRVLNKEGIELLYFEEEVKHIPCPDLNFFLVWNMYKIQCGFFDALD